MAFVKEASVPSFVAAHKIEAFCQDGIASFELAGKFLVEKEAGELSGTGAL